MSGLNFGSVTRITKADATTPIPVASTGTVYTPIFELYGGENFGVGLLAASSGTIDVLVELEESMSDMADITSETADVDMVEPDGFPDVINLTDGLLHMKQLTPVPAKYGRFKLTGQGSNHSSTTVRIDLFRQEII